MSASPPHLSVVDPEAPANSNHSGSRPPGSDPQETRDHRLTALAIALAVALLVLGFQVDRGRQLSAEVGALETDLATARGELADYNRQFAVVRERTEQVRLSFGDLERRIAGLSSAVSAEPVFSSIPAEPEP